MYPVTRLAPIVLLSVVGFAADLTGTWKMNVNKSKLSSDSEFTASIMKVGKTGTNTYHFSWHDTLRSGKQRRLTDTHICDGKEHPSQSGTGSMYVCDPDTLKHTFNRDGKPSSEIVLSFSPDGKTHTANRKRFGPGGNTISEELIVMERQ